VQSIRKAEVTLSLQADLIYLPVATSFVEKAAAAFGLAESEALSLTLATEEIFVYLCAAAFDKDIVLKCRSGGYYVDQEFLFEARDFNMKAFNLTASASMDDQDSMDETGLLIASRMVDRFQFFEEGKALRLILTKDKSYPSIDDLSAPDAKPLESFSIRPPDTEEIKLFVSLARKRYASPVTPQGFNFPGKVADMVACGEYRSAIASDQAGRLGGGIVWRWDGIRLVELYGPYILGSPDSGMSQALIDTCLSNVARIGAVGLICRYPTPELPAEYFEPLGSLIFRNEQNALLELTSYYRHLEEDLGLSVWSHDSIEPFLTNTYSRLAFAREIKAVRSGGESHSAFSVLSAEFDRGAGQVTLRPVWWGSDSESVLAAYVETLLKEKLDGILFEMDLGKSWQCYFTPALSKNGFEPRLVLPYAGKGDLVIFQHRIGGSP
jgi:anti-sigma regulatory factor (Ser/Thr protein kinase)